MNQGMMLYIHIPFCMQKCQYCDFLSGAVSLEQRAAYLKALQQEIAAWKGRQNEGITSVFIGGGTPSLLEPAELGPVLETVGDVFDIEANAEQTIEVNPGTVTREKADFWKQKGINRISMGVQSMDDALLRRLGRIHNRRQVLESYAILQDAGFTNISLDLMMALPGQTLRQWEDTLQQALALEPQHLSCYSLIIEEGTPFYEQQETLNLPDEESERAMYHHTQQLLALAGMTQYEISNFSRPGYEGAHNMGYWRRAPYIGLGLGASSLVGEVRYHNTADMERYVQLAAEPEALREEVQALSREEQMEEFMFLGLRCTQGVQKSEFARLFGCAPERIYGDAIQKHCQQGLLEEAGDRLRLTPKGLDVANYVFADFLLD